MRILGSENLKGEIFTVLHIQEKIYNSGNFFEIQIMKLKEKL